MINLITCCFEYMGREYLAEVGQHGSVVSLPGNSDEMPILCVTPNGHRRNGYVGGEAKLIKPDPSTLEKQRVAPARHFSL